jgi:hypothetical protein
VLPILDDGDEREAAGALVSEARDAVRWDLDDDHALACLVADREGQDARPVLEIVRGLGCFEGGGERVLVGRSVGCPRKPLREQRRQGAESQSRRHEAQS